MDMAHFAAAFNQWLKRWSYLASVRGMRSQNLGKVSKMVWLIRTGSRQRINASELMLSLG